MRRKLSNKLFVVVSQGAVGASTDMSARENSMIWIFRKHLRLFELEKCLFHLSPRCSFDVGFVHKTSIESTRSGCLQARKIKFAAFQNLSCHHHAPWHRFQSVTSDFKRGRENWANQIPIFPWLLREVRIARVISFVLERQAVCECFSSSAIFRTQQVGRKDEESDTWWKCKHRLLPLTKWIASLSAFCIEGCGRKDGFPRGPQKSP